MPPPKRPYGLRFEDDLLTWFSGLPNADPQTILNCKAKLQPRPKAGVVLVGDLWRDKGLEDNQDAPNENTPSTNPRLRVLDQDDWNAIADAFTEMLKDPAYDIKPPGRWKYRPTMPHTCCTWTCCAVVVTPQSTI